MTMVAACQMLSSALLFGGDALGPVHGDRCSFSFLSCSAVSLR